MSRPRTRIRKMWDWGYVIDPKRPEVEFNDATPVLVIPNNPAARRAMVERTIRTLWPHTTQYPDPSRVREVEAILATALTPSS